MRRNSLKLIKEQAKDNTTNTKEAFALNSFILQKHLLTTVHLTIWLCNFTWICKLCRVEFCD